MLSLLLTLSLTFAESPIDILNQMAEKQRWTVNTQRMTLTIDSQNNYIIYKMQTQMSINEEGLFAHARFLSPSEVENTQVTWIDRTEGDDEMWLFLPALGRITTLKDSNKNRAFMGSDFQFEDFALFTIQQSHTILDETDELWRIKSTPTSGSTPYTQWVTTLSKKTKQPTQVDLFINDTAVKQLQLKEGSLLNNAPSQMTMHTLATGSKTTLVIHSIDVSTPIPRSVFTKEYLLSSTSISSQEETP